MVIDTHSVTHRGASSISNIDFISYGFLDIKHDVIKSLECEEYVTYNNTSETIGPGMSNESNEFYFQVCFGKIPFTITQS